MTKYENIIKQKAQNKEPADIDELAKKYNMSAVDVNELKDVPKVIKNLPEDNMVIMDNRGPDIDVLAQKYKMDVKDVKKLKDNRRPGDLTRQIDELKQKVHDAELETSLIKAVGMNSPEMKAAKAEINTLKETLKSRDYTRQHD